ncbi:MAG: hypothetical protein KGL39_24535 [Patescibacteria group bacterium]|nr:hypothetical protein [Patescibacteria group bacterium]
MSKPIKIRGHIHSITAIGGGITDVEVMLILEARFSQSPLVLSIKQSEIENFRVGSLVEISVEQKP